MVYILVFAEVSSSQEIELSSVTEGQPEWKGSIGKRLPLYLLGKDRDNRWTFAIDISGCKEAFLRSGAITVSF